MLLASLWAGIITAKVLLFITCLSILINMNKLKTRDSGTTKVVEILKRLLFLALIIFFIAVVVLFLFGQKYKNDNKNRPTKFGVTFSARQAEKFGLDPDEVLVGLLDDMGIRRFRLMSYWDDIEKNKGTYDYSILDKQINEVVQRGGEITLAIGLRQPRWPECYLPEWARGLTIEQYRSELDKFIGNTVNRYKDNPNIESWQLENEFHLAVFGNCPDHSRRRLVEEYQLVKSIDDKKPVVLSLANNYFGFPVGDPRPDLFGVSIYSRVYESRFLKNYLSYPFPSWYYGGRAGITKFLTGKESVLHELQLEPWGPRDINEMTVEEQNKSMDATRVKRQLRFAQDAGFKTIDMWGGEWWYWKKTKTDNPEIWEIIKKEINKNQ